ncbi:4a-hydroxytetrahydrobiopterin dehydratase [Synechococcus sp. CS-1329]|jgi:4a-hydroxytetrahydrobiopterin dehydratase|uniref:4a-hydroxytetrahydrobiopterin dehydratase n=1 Tax=Synechococcus sp. CS-1329 TaxID=2847975 RepID=UPI00223C3B0B|nr:4a-hydroxytetrahydrobiopterin dehydratase [Synechococcus sp. CS-1329]MCT0218212.1 4a-hydroxytetrahydrobiopterin dehydratase [Synechococcus sp. CS-1329]
MDQPWTHRQRPERLERRIEFADYETTRAFLERLNEWSEQEKRYPDISFGRTYVNLTLRPQQEDGPIEELDHALATAIDALLP